MSKDKSEKKPSLDEKIQMYKSDHQDLLEKLGLGLVRLIHFPGRNKVPFLSRMCLKIVQMQGGQIGSQFYEQENK